MNFYDYTTKSQTALKIISHLALIFQLTKYTKKVHSQLCNQEVCE